MAKNAGLSTQAFVLCNLFSLHCCSVHFSIPTADSLREGYHQLRALVMAYGDISPESPLSLTSTSQLTTQQTTTSITTSERTSPQPKTGTQTPSLLLDPSEASQQQLRQHQLTPEAVLHMQEVAKVWARPSSSQSAPGGGSRTTSVSGVQQRVGSRTPVSHF